MSISHDESKKVTAESLVPTKGTDNDLCIVRPHIGEPRCREHHEESWWPNNKRCDKPAGHKGKHITFQRTLYGLDENRFSVWDDKGYSAHFEKKA